MVDPDDPTPGPDDPTPGPGPDDPTPDPEPQPDEALTATMGASEYSITSSTVGIKTTLAREEGLTAEDKQDWTIVDPTDTLTQTKVSITTKGVITFTVGRVDTTSLNSGSVTMKVMHGGATYATTTVNYSPSASITTDSVDKLLTDGAETITGLRINNVIVDLADYDIVSADSSAAIVENGTITPLQPGQAIFIVNKKDDVSKTAQAKITFFTPAAKVGDTYYKTLANAFNKAPSGSVIVMQEDATESINFSGTTPRTQDFELTLDLNGHTLTAPAGKDYAVRVDYGTITIKDSVGTGGINYGDNYAMMISHLAGDYPSKVIIESGNFTGKTSVVQAGLPGGSGANYKYYGGDLVIKGGTFTAVPDTGETYDENGNFKYLLNMLDMNESAYAGGIYSPSTISVEGGSFKKFNPADCAAEGPNTNFVAEGYQVTKDGDWYTVSAV